MKDFAILLLALWVLSGFMAALLLVDERDLRASDIALGPVSLMRAMSS